MGNAVSYEGHKIAQVGGISQSYTAQEYDWCITTDFYGSCVGGYEYPTRYHTKKINGTLKSASTNVYINEKSASYKGAETSENCAWESTPPNYYSGGDLHSDGSGTVNGGSSTVYVNGKAIARKDDSVSTHESGRTTTIEEGSSDVFAG